MGNKVDGYPIPMNTTDTARTALKKARKQADAEFNDSCEKLKQAIEGGDQQSISAAYNEMCNALNRCNELGLF